MFSDTRRMGRDNNKLREMNAAKEGNTRCFELLRLLKLSLGEWGAFYCGDGSYGQNEDKSILDFNSSKQPGLWCQWVIGNTATGNTLEWNGAEKFYNYVEWLKYMIANFFIPWGYKLNGMVEWKGEEHQDFGVIEVTNNEVITHEGMSIKDIKTVIKKEKATKPKAKPVSVSLTLDSKSAVFKVSNATVSDMVLDLMKLRNKLVATSKGTKVAARMVDVLIAKYEA